ncbi:MAG: hypothetical protein IJ009_06045 [Clostridia bacterium]|nr:hypothetical protein [Clostridia bacterium]
MKESPNERKNKRPLHARAEATPPAADAALFERSSRAQTHAARSYADFLHRSLQKTNAFAVWRRIRAVFAPTLWIGRAVRVMWRVFTFLETGTFLLLLALLFLLLLPVLAVLALAFAVAAMEFRRRENVRLAPRLCGARVLAFFPAERTDFTDRALADLVERYTVLLVTDFPSEFAQGESVSPLHAAVHRSDGVLLVREHYYFYLRRTLLRESAFFAAIF